MLAIRLSPVGKKGQKYFRVIVSEKTKDVFGDYIELLGSYNPHPNPPEVNLKTDRIKHWLDKGAEMSPTVHNLFVDQKIIEDKKVTSWKPKKQKPKEGEEASGEKPAEAKAEAKSAEAKPEEKPKETEAKPEEKPEEKPREDKPEKKKEEAKPAAEVKPKEEADKKEEAK